MDNKQFTRKELFEIWMQGNYTVAELAKKYGYEMSGLSHQFTKFLKERAKNKWIENEAVM
jgi:hypothetical protein